MRIRHVKPEFYTDEVVGRLSDEVRLFYIGLWAQADDAGWFRWQPARIAAELYPYRPVSTREKNVERWMSDLVGVGRIVLLSCGCGQIPTFTRHQYKPSRPSVVVQSRHSEVCLVIPSVPSVAVGMSGEPLPEHGLGSTRKVSASLLVEGRDKEVVEVMVEGKGAGATDDAPEWPILQWLAQHGCDIVPGNGYHRRLITAVEVHGTPALITAMERLEKAGTSRGDTKGYVFGAIDLVKPKPDLRKLEAEEREDQAARARTNREERAARKLAYLRGEITEAEYDSGMKP